MLYTVAVEEVVSTRRLYLIEASSEIIARCKAEMGDNVDELDLDDGEVIDRIVVSGTTRITGENSL